MCEGRGMREDSGTGCMTPPSLGGGGGATLRIGDAR